ncbi:hypothetical protein ILYODFUR_035859 [Ilyodon furcidens]|uniref:Uncharacterized protein n=1 Tax=Ilyodon furcidens TaxID=33524 RepID=A0ABV0UMY3_9TELE
MVAQLVALLPCSKKVLGSTPGLMSFCMEFAGSPRACVSSLWQAHTEFFQSSGRQVQRRLEHLSQQRRTVSREGLKYNTHAGEERRWLWLSEREETGWVLGCSLWISLGPPPNGVSISYPPHSLRGLVSLLAGVLVVLGVWGWVLWYVPAHSRWLWLGSPPCLSRVHGQQVSGSSHY